MLESRLAWLLYDEAYNKAAETQDKVKAAKKNLADRKRQLDESQAPIKSVLSSASVEPSLVLSHMDCWLLMLQVKGVGCTMPACQLTLLQSCQRGKSPTWQRFSLLF